MGVRVHLIDGTYELFRQHFGVPEEARSREGTTAAVRGVLNSTLALLEEGATHVGVATDQVIESFRNDLWPAYKTSAGMDPVLLAQFPVLEEALEAMGVHVWPMTDLEADDALASAAAVAADDDRVDQVIILTPDKDLGQCVRGRRVVQYDRRKQMIIDADGVRDKAGVDPESVPDWLALVGDSADGFPGLPGWGAKSAAAVLAHYRHLEHIPDDVGQWEVTVRGGAKLAATLAQAREAAALFKELATLRVDRNLLPDVEALRWVGPTAAFAQTCERLGPEAQPLLERAVRLGAARRSALSGT